jgi:hypothetical protein
MNRWLRLVYPLALLAGSIGTGLAQPGVPKNPATVGQQQGPPAAGFIPKYIGSPGKICVERYEDEGLANIAPITVLIGGTAEFTLTGGEAACLWLSAPVKTLLRLRWTFQYGVPQDEGTPLETLAIPIEVMPGSTERFYICRTRTGSGERNPTWSLNVAAATGNNCAR